MAAVTNVAVTKRARQNECVHRLLASNIEAEALDEVRRTLEAGGVICFPTDTLYGLGVDPSNEAALDRIYDLKGRPKAKPILLLVDSLRMARSVSEPDARFRRVADAFWPGPITLITRAAPELSQKVTAGTGTVGLRWPDRPLVLDLIRSFGRPLTATSANVSNMPVARSADEAIEQLGSGIDLLIDADPLPKSKPSTVLDLTSQPPVVLREGPVSFEVIRVFLDGMVKGVKHEP